MLNKAKKNEINICDSYVVLGSGPNAVSTIHGILDNKKDQEKKIFVIDAGLTKDSNLSFKKRNNDLKTPSPKFKIKANQYVHDSFNSMLNIVNDGFEAIGSLSKGGLSNIWGAGIQPYTNKELSRFPYTYDEIKHIYTKIYEILTGSKNKIFIDNYLRGDDIVISDPLLAIKKKKNDLSFCNINNCDDGCVSCNRNVFNSSNEIDQLVSSNKIEYMSDLFINSVMYKNKCYEIKCTEISSSKTVVVYATNIYCCLGAISTSKIVLGMHKQDNYLPLLCTPGGSFFIFSFKNFHKENHAILSSKLFAGSLSNHSYEGNIFPISKNLICSSFGNWFGNILYNLFGKLLFSKLFIANIYFDSGMNNTRIGYSNNQLKISSYNNPKLKKFFRKVIKNIRKAFLSKGLLLVPFCHKLLLPGQDVHYGGSVPMKENPNTNECHVNGELKGYKNFYISDASAMPFLASKGQTFNSMVNAYYVASKSVSSSNE